MIESTVKKELAKRKEKKENLEKILKSDFLK
jgi:hypothetical protein